MSEARTDTPATTFVTSTSTSLKVPIAASLLSLVFWQTAPRIRAESYAAFILSSVLYMILIVWLAASVGRALNSPRAIVVAGVLAASVALPFRVMIGLRIPAATWLYVAVPGLSDLLMVWLAGSLGAALSLVIRGANLIPPVAAVLALVDIWTVLLGGPVQQIMQSENPTAKAVTQAMTVQLAAPRATGAVPSPLLIGFADFLFIAFFVAALCRFSPGTNAYGRTLIGLLATLSVFLLVVAFIPTDVPALVPMAVVMIALHWRIFHYERSEVFALLYASLFIAVIALAFWYFGRPTQKNSRAPLVLRMHNSTSAFHVHSCA